MHAHIYIHYFFYLNQDKCPDFQLPDGNVGTCALSDDCNKVTCTVPPESDLPNLFGFDVLTVQAYGCRQSVKATVNFESSQGVTKWSHTFEDGEKAALPATPAPNLKILLKVELKKNGSKVHFKVQCNTQVIVWRCMSFVRQFYTIYR